MRPAPCLMDLWLLLWLAALAGGCNSSTPPQAPSASNFAPNILSATAAPVFGIQDLTTFTFTAQASDPEGGPLAYRWEFQPGVPGPQGQTVSTTLNVGGQVTPRLIVSDNAGNSATTTTNPIIVGTMTGAWTGTGPSGLGSFTMSLEQRPAGAIVGTLNSAIAGSGAIAADQPGSIDAGGRVTMRVDMATSADFEMRGELDQSGRLVSGQLFGAGFTGEPFTLSKPAP
jgi:hypothetical protein